MRIAVIDNQTLEIINLEDGKNYNLINLLIEALSIDFDALANSINELSLKNTKWDYRKIINRAFKDNDIKMSQLIIDKYEKEYEELFSAIRSQLPHEQTEYIIDNFMKFLKGVLVTWKDTFEQIISTAYLMHTSNVMLKSYYDENNTSPIPPPLEGMKSSVEFSFHEYNGNFYDAFNFNDYVDFLSFAVGKTLQNKILIKPCANCGEIFYPQKRSDEKYCDRIFQGNRTCKQVGYENRDEFIKVYRTAYKTKNATKNRNLKNNPNAEKNFKKWVCEAKLKLDEARRGDIPLENFKNWLKQ